MKCRDCKYMKTADYGRLLICINEESSNFMQYTGICREDECEDGKEKEDDLHQRGNNRQSQL